MGPSPRMLEGSSHWRTSLAVGVLCVGTLAVSACSSSSSSSTTVPGLQTVVTSIGQTYTDEWIPAEQPSPETLAALKAALSNFGASTLLPNETVSELQDATATFRITRSAPTNVVTVTLGIGGNGAGLSLDSRRIADSPVDCQERLTQGNGEEWESVTVRGLAGCTYTNDVGLLFLEWEEGGNRFGVQTRLILDTVTSWLDSWSTTP